MYVEHMIKQTVNACVDVIIYDGAESVSIGWFLKTSMATVGGLLQC